MATLKKAIEIAVLAHSGQKDKGGERYIFHCFHVMNRVSKFGNSYMIVAVLHDLIEDTHWSINNLIHEGFSDEIIEALILLDKTYLSNDYDSYILKISTNDISRQVKVFDLEHNMDVTRLKTITKNDLKRIEKYHKAYTFLKNI
jgi:(p)ppGpp synthase/HD superfamily hydrolase